MFFFAARISEDTFYSPRVGDRDQFSNPEATIDETLKKLDIGYIDMMLLHHPGVGDVVAYKEMERINALDRGEKHDWYQ